MPPFLASSCARPAGRSTGDLVDRVAELVVGVARGKPQLRGEAVDLVQDEDHRQLLQQDRREQPLHCRPEQGPGCGLRRNLAEMLRSERCKTM